MARLPQAKKLINIAIKPKESFLKPQLVTGKYSAVISNGLIFVIENGFSVGKIKCSSSLF